MPNEIKPDEIKSLKNFFYLTVGKLKKILEDYPEDGMILVERVEDLYFDTHNWGVVKKENPIFNQLKEIGKDDESGMIDNKEKYPTPITPLDDLELEGLKDQYCPAFSVAKYYDDKDNVYIKLHY